MLRKNIKNFISINFILTKNREPGQGCEGRFNF